MAFILLSRANFLSPLYRCRFCVCMRALVYNFLYPPLALSAIQPSLVPVSQFRPLRGSPRCGRTSPRLSSQQGSNSGFRNELRLIALIAGRDGFIIPSSITPSERVIIRLFKPVPHPVWPSFPISPLCHCYIVAFPHPWLFLRTAKIASSK